ncbi:unnamed protein product [Staurois parvus]|uniref:RRM domain-containing protein n=1 Tax=Staurois parvus TaxID=386267 RepID=A0ABN9C664_9NEOB|nr:unnamed protein product [Staurois parvus]
MKNRKSNHRGFGFIDLKNHKEAIRLTVLVRDLKPPLTINGKTISVDLAVGQRRTEHGKSGKGNKSSPGKNRKQRARGKPFTYPGFRTEEGPSYIYDPKTGDVTWIRYLTPFTMSPNLSSKSGMIILPRSLRGTRRRNPAAPEEASLRRQKRKRHLRGHYRPP